MILAFVCYLEEVVSHPVDYCEKSMGGILQPTFRDFEIRDGLPFVHRHEPRIPAFSTAEIDDQFIRIIP